MAYAHAAAGRRYRSHAYESRRHRSGSLGVRRPLRYLAYHLDLDDDQRRKVAAALEQVKLEREQARLDRKRADSAVADVILDEDVSVDALRDALKQRAETAAHLQAVIAKALYDVAVVLDPEQREEFAHLLRTGVLRL